LIGPAPFPARIPPSEVVEPVPPTFTVRVEEAATTPLMPTSGPLKFEMARDVVVALVVDAFVMNADGKLLYPVKRFWVEVLKEVAKTPVAEL
jgi:hypothetical protein